MVAWMQSERNLKNNKTETTNIMSSFMNKNMTMWVEYEILY